MEPADAKTTQNETEESVCLTEPEAWEKLRQTMLAKSTHRNRDVALLTRHCVTFFVPSKSRWYRNPDRMEFRERLNEFGEQNAKYLNAYLAYHRVLYYLDKETYDYVVDHPNAANIHLSRLRKIVETVNERKPLGAEIRAVLVSLLNSGVSGVEMELRLRQAMGKADVPSTSQPNAVGTVTTTGGTVTTTDAGRPVIFEQLKFRRKQPTFAMANGFGSKEDRLERIRVLSRAKKERKKAEALGLELPPEPKLIRPANVRRTGFSAEAEPEGMDPVKSCKRVVRAKDVIVDPEVKSKMEQIGSALLAHRKAAGRKRNIKATDIVDALARESDAAATAVSEGEEEEEEPQSQPPPPPLRKPTVKRARGTLNAEKNEIAPMTAIVLATTTAVAPAKKKVPKVAAAAVAAKPVAAVVVKPFIAEEEEEEEESNTATVEDTVLEKKKTVVRPLMPPPPSVKPTAKPTPPPPPTAVKPTPSPQPRQPTHVFNGVLYKKPTSAPPVQKQFDPFEIALNLP